MWQKFKEQLPAVILTALLVIGGAFYIHQQTVAQMAARQALELEPIRAANDALKAQNDDTRRQMEATNKLLKDAIAKRESDLFRTDEEMAKLNGERMDALADAIAKKVMPFNPLPKSAEEAEKMQTEQVDKVSTRMAERIQPILAEMSRDQNLTRESIGQYSDRISAQVGTVLAAETAKNQQLNNNLQATQSVAQESLKLSHEITALYLSGLKDQGLITRLLSLPANVVKDVATLSVVSSSDRKKMTEELGTKLAEIQKRLDALQAQAPQAAAAPAAPATPTTHPTRPTASTP